MRKRIYGAGLLLLSLTIVGIYSFFNKGIDIYRYLVVFVSLGLLVPSCVLFIMDDNERLKRAGKTIGKDDMNV